MVFACRTVVDFHLRRYLSAFCIVAAMGTGAVVLDAILGAVYEFANIAGVVLFIAAPCGILVGLAHEMLKLLSCSARIRRLLLLAIPDEFQRDEWAADLHWEILVMWRRECARRLLSLGIRADHPFLRKSFTIHTAAMRGWSDIVEMLIEAGAVLTDDMTGEGYTPLAAAIQFGHPDVVRVLISAGMSVEGTHGDGQSTLHCAAWYGNPDIVRQLIFAGANPNLKDVHGKTPRDYAREEGHHEVASFLDDLSKNDGHTENPGSY